MEDNKQKAEAGKTPAVVIPEPIDTSDVQLPEELKEIGEKIAENVHNAWAKSRLEQGWTYGKERNDQLKTHPGLVLYEDLSEEEKDYDRTTGLGTLKLILKLGYTITKKTE